MMTSSLYGGVITFCIAAFVASQLFREISILSSPDTEFSLEQTAHLMIGIGQLLQGVGQLGSAVSALDLSYRSDRAHSSYRSPTRSTSGSSGSDGRSLSLKKALEVNESGHGLPGGKAYRNLL